MGTSLIFWIFCLILSTGLAQTDALSQLETCGDDTDGVCLLQLKHHEGVMNEGAGVDLHVVQGAAAGGDGSVARPFATVQACVDALSSTGSVVSASEVGRVRCAASEWMANVLGDVDMCADMCRDGARSPA